MLQNQMFNPGRLRMSLDDYGSEATKTAGMEDIRVGRSQSHIEAQSPSSPEENFGFDPRYSSPDIYFFDRHFPKQCDSTQEWYCFECIPTIDKTFSSKMIKGIRFEHFIECVIHAPSIFRHVLFYTYKEYTTKFELLDAFAKRFDVPCPPNLTPNELSSFRDRIKKKIQIKIVAVIKFWATNFWDKDFQNDMLFQSKFDDFCDTIANSLPQAGSLLKRALNRQRIPNKLLQGYTSQLYFDTLKRQQQEMLVNSILGINDSSSDDENDSAFIPPTIDETSSVTPRTSDFEDRLEIQDEHHLSISSDKSRASARKIRRIQTAPSSRNASLTGDEIDDILTAVTPIDSGMISESDFEDEDEDERSVSTSAQMLQYFFGGSSNNDRTFLSSVEQFTQSLSQATGSLTPKSYQSVKFSARRTQSSPSLFEETDGNSNRIVIGAKGVPAKRSESSNSTRLNVERRKVRENKQSKRKKRSKRPNMGARSSLVGPHFLRLGQLEILRFSCDEFVECLMLLDCELFLAMNVGELVSFGSNKECRANSPSVWRIVDQFNNLSKTIRDEVLSRPKATQRSRLLSFFLRVTQKLLKERNFGSAHAVWSGITSNPVHRLKQSWAYLRAYDKTLYDKLKSTFTMEDEKFPITIRNLSPADGRTVPHIAFYVKDTIRIRENIPSTFRDDFINIHKFTMLAERCIEMQEFQNGLKEPNHRHTERIVKYWGSIYARGLPEKIDLLIVRFVPQYEWRWNPHVILMQYLAHVVHTDRWTEDEAWEVSEKLEPRKKTSDSR